MEYIDNMYLFDNDMNAIVDGIKGYGIVSGCIVTAQGTPDMTVAVASGVVVANGTTVSVTGTNKTVVHDDTNPRKYIISVNSSGTVTATAGTAAVATPAASVGPYTSVPIPPDVPANEVLLAEIWVEANATEIHSDDITDRRINVVQYVKESDVLMTLDGKLIF
jgi:hypothetical protein